MPEISRCTILEMQAWDTERIGLLFADPRVKRINRSSATGMASRYQPPGGRLLQRLAERDHPVDAGQERRAVESSVAVGGSQLAAGLLPLGDVLRRAENQVHAGQRGAQRAVLG